MRRRSFRDNLASLAIGIVIGAAITLPVKAPVIGDYARQKWSEWQYEIEITILGVDFTNLSESNADHGDTLEEVIDGIHDTAYEHEAVFYGERKLFEVTSFNPDRVAFLFSYWCPSWQRDTVESKIIDLHNHPESDLSFSYGDLERIFYDRYARRYMIVALEHVYTLIVPDDWQPKEDELDAYFRDHFGVDLSEEITSMDQYRKLISMEDEGYITLTKGEGYLGIGFTSKLIAELADYFGLIYEVEPFIR